MIPRQHLLGVASFTFLTISACSSPSPENRPLLTFKGNTGIANRVTYSPDGKRIASCHQDPPGESENPHVLPSIRPKKFDMRREVKIWDANTGKEQMSLNKGSITSAIIFSANGRSLAGAVGNTVRIWDVATGKENLVLKGHADVVHDLDISHDGKWLATASSDSTVKIWDALTGVCVHTLKGHSKGVFYVSFSPDGKHLAGSGGDRDREGEIQIWDWTSEKKELSLIHDASTRRGLFSPVGKVLFSPNGEHLACYIDQITTSKKPGLVEVWDVSLRKLLFRCESHSEEVTCIAYSPEGKFLASGSEDGTVIMRDDVRGDELLKLAAAHRNGYTRITSIAFSPRGDRLATATWDGTINIWDMKHIKTDNTIKVK